MSKRHILVVRTPSIAKSSARKELVKTISLLHSASFYEPLVHKVDITYEGKKEIDGAIVFKYSFKNLRDAQDAENKAKALGLKTKVVKSKVQSRQTIPKEQIMFVGPSPKRTPTGKPVFAKKPQPKILKTGKLVIG